MPGGLKLHQYANLYFHARNPMLFKRLSEAGTLCILRVSTAVLTLAGTVISDQNAASDYVRFYHPSQCQGLDFDEIFALDWRHPNDLIAFWRHKARKCAEVLVPQRVDANDIVGAYVIDAAANAAVLATGFNQPVTVNPGIFFR